MFDWSTLWKSLWTVKKKHLIKLEILTLFIFRKNGFIFKYVRWSIWFSLKVEMVDDIIH